MSASEEDRPAKGAPESEPSDAQGEGFVADDREDADGNTRDAETDPAVAGGNEA